MDEAQDMDIDTGTGTTSGEGTTGTSDEGTKEISSHPTNSSNYLHQMNDDDGLQLSTADGNELKPKGSDALPMVTMQTPRDEVIDHDHDTAGFYG